MAIVKSSKYFVVGVQDNEVVYSGDRLASRFGNDGHLIFIFGVDGLSIHNHILINGCSMQMGNRTHWSLD